MSQDLSEIMKAWEKSQERQMKESVKLPKRFYDVRKRPSPRPSPKIRMTGRREQITAERRGLAPETLSY